LVRTTTREAANAIERYEALWRFDQASWVRQGWAATANMLVERSAFEAIGGFDPEYRHIGEDADFCIRARRAGHELGLCPGAVVTHEAERELRPMLRRAWRHGYSGNQTYHRIGVGYRAWRRPGPMLRAQPALALHQLDAGGLNGRERTRMARLAQLNYAARVAGSAWAELRRVR
jgi:GT2 family glycosyltransferase